MPNLLILHGPNLNLLGQRENKIYGDLDLETINNNCENLAKTLNLNLTLFQSNSETDLINQIQEAKNQSIDFIIFNPAAYTHTSIALRDALLAVAIPFIEVHLSNIYQREAFRHKSYFSDIAQAVICGCGPKGYEFAIEQARIILQQSP